MEISKLLPVALSAGSALVAVNWVYFKILRIALSKNLVDNPEARKLQKRPVPVMGGMAVFFGILSGVLAGAVFHACMCGGVPDHQLAVVCAMSVMLYVGVMDDIQGLTPRSRLVVEVLVMVALVYATGSSIDTFRGMWGVDCLPSWLAVPLTVFTGVGIINAVNMIDGVNGLSSGLCVTCCLIFGAVFVKMGDVSNAVLAFSTVFALLPFFVHNVFGQRSRMFIGDGGTMVMGLLLAWFVMHLLHEDPVLTSFMASHGVNAVALTLSILSVPVFDTLRVMGMRMARGTSPFHPDKTHLHHVFVNVGVSHFITAVSEILIGIVIVLCWMVSVWKGASQETQLYVVITSSVLLVWGTYALLRYHARRHTEFLHLLTEFSVRTHLGRTELWKRLTAFLDAPCDGMEGMLSAVELQAKLSRRFEHVAADDYKEQDRRKVLEFMKGRAEVMVDDILRHSGAERLRVYSLLIEEKLRGTICVLKEDGWGAPEIVSLNGDAL